jgi:hypothetical protein
MENTIPYNFTASELIEILKQYPKDMPVVISAQENGYENFYQPFVKKVKHQPENPHYEGQFQIDDTSSPLGDTLTEVIILQREFRND